MAVEENDGDSAFLDDVFATGRDRGADSAAPEPEPLRADEPASEAPKEPDVAKPDAKGEDPSKQFRDPETGRFVPLTELKSEREKRQEAQRLREEAERTAAYYRGQLEAYQRNLASQQQPQQQQEFQPPDPFDDPNAYRQYVVGEAQRAALNERLNASQMMAEDRYGADAVNAALQAAQAAGVARQFIGTAHPYREMVEWHKRATAIQKIGDPEQYEKSLREKMREELLAELKGTKPASNGAAAQQQRFPGTLADATGSGPQGAMAQTDEGMMGEIFGHGRRSRRA